MIPCIEIDPVDCELILNTGASIVSNDQTLFVDANMNISNVLSVDAVSGITSFNLYTGGQMIPCIEIDPVDCELILNTGASIVSNDQTLFIDANMNISNIFTVDSVNGNINIGYEISNQLVPTISINAINGSIYCTGSTGIGYFNKVSTNNLLMNYNVFTGATGSINLSRGKIYVTSSDGTDIFVQNSLVDINTSIFTNVNGYDSLYAVPSIIGAVPNNGYFYIYLSNSCPAGQVIKIDWFIIN
jgi:hypothetical protein